MQLQFTFEQLRLLFRVLEQDCRELRDRISKTNDLDLKKILLKEEIEEEQLLDKVIGRRLQFGADELDELADVLRNYQRKLRDESLHASTPEAKDDANRRREAIELLLDRIVEACAML